MAQVLARSFRHWYLTLWRSLCQKSLLICNCISRNFNLRYSQTAGWSSESTFQRFYYRPSDNSSFDRAVLNQHSQSATNNTIDMGDWAFWIIIHKWLRSQSSCQLFGEDEVEHINCPTHPSQRERLQLFKGWIGWFDCGFCFYPENTYCCEKAVQLREPVKHRWYAWLHLLHIIPNSWQPLCGLSHLWIFLLLVQSITH